MRVSESKLPNKMNDFIQSCEYSELALEGVLPEECLKHCVLILSLIVPIRITHSQLIMICK